MDTASAPLARPPTDVSPALLAKGALRRLATERLEPTPENYARAYRQEAGDDTSAAMLPPRAQRLVERVVASAFAADPTRAGADFSRAMAEGRWAEAEHVLDRAPAQAAEALAVLLERIVRGIERGGQTWTVARRKVGIQRVLDASRSDSRRLQQRLSQLVKSWESDPISAAAPLDWRRGGGGNVARAGSG